MHTEHHTDLSENKSMQSIFYTPLYAFVLTLCTVLQAHAQPEPNVLGLPAVPQTSAASAPNPAVSASAVRKTASGASPASAVPLSDSQIKSVISGGVTMASSYLQRTATVRVTTNNIYQTEEQRKTAISAGRLVQRDLRISCGKQCKPAANMPVPKILPDGKLQFDMVIEDYPRVLTQDDMIAMVLGNPLAVLPKTAPASAPAAPPATAPPAPPMQAAPASAAQ
jgi:hypothetical protein